jgi:two-component system sensor histidine kinase UhpB
MPREQRSQPSPSAGQKRSLLWWVYLVNASVLVVAFLLLVFTPITLDAPPTLAQVSLLVAGLAVMLVLNFVLMRWVLRPLIAFTRLMSSVDPDRPGTRLRDTDLRSREGVAMARAFNSMLERLEHGRREASRRALAAQEAERVRVARELHDEVGQSLTAAMIHAEHAAGPEAGTGEIEVRHVIDSLHESLDEVRRIARELRPEALDDLGLINALIALCSRVDAQGVLTVRRELGVRLPALGPETELVIYRVAQEGLTNALRHANATEATLSLSAGAGQLILSVADNGTGLPSTMPADTVGIAGMRERAMLVDGRLEIESRPDAGTEVRLTVPVGER